MTSANPLEDLNLGRTWLNRAAEMLDGCEDHQSDAEFARAAAIIGNGFIALAHAERAAVSMAETSQVRQAILTMSDEPETTLAEAIEREKRAEAEARPHDDEPRFVGFTEHGHPVVDQLPPFAAAPCGGPASCGECADDTGDLRRAAREARRG